MANYACPTTCTECQKEYAEPISYDEIKMTSYSSPVFYWTITGLVVKGKCTACPDN